jgi:hypothetical protein
MQAGIAANKFSTNHFKCDQFSFKLAFASGDKLGLLEVYYAGAGAKRLLPSISQRKQIKLLFQSREPGRLLVISIALLSLQTAPSVLFAN